MSLFFSTSKFPLRSAFLATASACASVGLIPTAEANNIDVALLFVTKTELFQQTSPADPVLRPNPFTIRVGANASQNDSIISGQFAEPGGTFKNLSNDGNGNLSFDGGSFATMAALNAAFPNGAYNFNLQTVTPPQAFSSFVTITGDTYPNVPKISGTWSSGGLQVDAGQGYTFDWDPFQSSSDSDRITLQIVDSAGQQVFSQSGTPIQTFSFFMPANTLSRDQYYTATLFFERRQIAVGTTAPNRVAAYSALTTFKIATIGGVPALSGPSAPSGTVGQLFVYQVVATNHPFSFDASALPPGLTFDSTTGIISGIPTAPGTTQIQLTAQNIDGVSPVKNIASNIQSVPSSGPVIVSSTSALYYRGAPFTFQVLTKGATGAARITATGLPAGLSLDPVTGIISGAATAVGSFTVNLTVTDGSFTATGFLELIFTADPAYPVITNANTVIVPRGQPFSYTIATPGATDPADPPVFGMAGTLPAGLSFDPKTATISGTYTGNPIKDDGPPDPKELSGGALLGTVQLFGTNSHGTSSFQLLFLAPPSGAVNISTRLLVGIDEDVLIGGFIITGNAPKVVIIRAMGPSLGIPAALQDPVLQLHSGLNVITNDNWRNGIPNQEQLILDTSIPPNDDREAALVASLDPGPYTAIVSGKNGGTGIGLVEVYDLGTASADSTIKVQLAQISTRGKVLTGDDVMIGGFIVSGVTTRILIRGIGPELSASGIQNALQDPTLQLVDGNGTTTAFNDDWRSDQEQAIIDTTVPPTDDRESAVVANLVPGPYTAVLRGKNNITGVALVEVYALQ